MTITARDIRKIQGKIKPLFGKKAWGVSLGFGSFITFEFGEKQIKRFKNREYIHGEWHLWITYCAWRLEQKNKVLACSEDDRSELQGAVKRLENQSLLSVEFTPPAWETSFQFGKGIKLRLFPIYSADYDHWLLFMPDGNVITIGPGTTWSCENADAPSYA